MSFGRYPKYKESGIEMLGSIPAHWEVHRLKRICDTFPSNVDKHSNPDETPVRLCNYTDVYYNEVIGDDLEFMSATASDDQIARFTLRSGDTLLTKDSETADDIAVSSYVPNDLPGVVCGYHLAISRPRTGTVGRYVKRLFDSAYAKACCANLANGLTRVGLGQHDLDNIDFPVPSPTEQAAIASFLDHETAKIDALIAEQERLVELLREERQAVISHAVTKGLNPNAPMKPSGIEWLGDIPAHWALRPLKHLVTMTSGGTPSKANLEYWDGEIPWASSKDLKKHELPDTEDHLTQLALDDGAAELVPIGSVLVCVRGMILAHTFPVATTRVAMAINQDLKALNSRESMNNQFLAWLLRGTAGASLARVDEAAHGTKVLRLDGWAQMSVPEPPIKEQLAITQFAVREDSRFSQLLIDVRRQIELLVERRSALISASVTGQIDVRESAATPISSEKPYNSGFARQLLAAEILANCHQYPSTGRVKLQKLLHLCEYVAEIREINGSYERQAAGPFDNKLMFGVAAGLKKQRWFSESAGTMGTRYTPMAKAGSHVKYLRRWELQLPQIRRVLALLGHRDTESCEIISTLYAAWNDLLIDGNQPSDAETIRHASDPSLWHEAKSKIDPKRWPRALQWMKDQGLIPVGFGKHTRGKK